MSVPKSSSDLSRGAALPKTTPLLSWLFHPYMWCTANILDFEKVYKNF